MIELGSKSIVANEKDVNRDPFSGTPGAHPLVNPTAEEQFWRETYVREPFYVAGRSFEYYAPGLRAGWEGRVRHDGRSFDQAEAELMLEYNECKTELDPSWEAVSPAARAAWNRVDRSWSAEQ